jgi:hypothetical protein
MTDITRVSLVVLLTEQRLHPFGSRIEANEERCPESRQYQDVEQITAETSTLCS